MNRYKIEAGSLYYKNELVAAFIPKINGIDVLHDCVTDVYTYKYHVSVETQDSATTQEKIFEFLQNIPFHKYWKECAGADMLSKRKKRLLNEYLYLLSQQVTTETQECFNSIRNSTPVLYEKPNLSELTEYLASLLTIKGGETEILFLCKMAALLKPLLEKADYPMNFFVFLYGHSGVGKTSLAKLFFVQESGQDKSFKMDNMTEICKALKAYQGDTVLVDDYHPEASDYRKKRQISVIDLLARQTDCYGTALAVSTAEIREGCFSLQDREIQIEISDTAIDWNKFAYCKQNISQFQYVLYGICHEIYENESYIVELISKAAVRKTGNFRITRYIETLKLVMDILEDLLGTKPIWEMLEKKLQYSNMKTHWYKLLDLIEDKQTQYMKCLREQENGIDWIKVFYEMLNDSRIFRRVPEDYIKKHSDDNVKDVYVAGSTIYVAEFTFLAGIHRYFEYRPEQSKDARSCKKKIVNALKAEEILLVDSTKANTKKKCGKRFYEIDYKRLQYFYKLQNI